ncbi:MAG TPA: farnesyl diphosphate synthase [Bacillales bacterium]
MIEKYFHEKIQKVNAFLYEQIKQKDAPDQLKESMLYSVQAGGKRLRPILLLATMEAFGRDADQGLPVACAIEMVHTYSLIHDDLPAMDDDDLRRGKPTNHKVFGEAMAVLAGDALLTLSFEVVADIKDRNISGQMKADLVTRLARAAGAEGMVGGQSSDLRAEGQTLLPEELENIHLHKTGKLLSFPVEAGALLAGANAGQIEVLSQFSGHLGLAFQIRDDILDVEGDTQRMGKSAGSDINKQKSTYPQLLTMAGAKQKLSYHLLEAKRCLHQLDIQYERLDEITDYIVDRNR